MPVFIAAAKIKLFARYRYIERCVVDLTFKSNYISHKIFGEKSNNFLDIG